MKIKRAWSYRAHIRKMNLLSKSKHQKLVDLINTYDHAYWVENKPAVPDAEYDQRMKELVALEHQHPELKTLESPTMRLGGGLSEGFESVAHTAPMLSLDNLFNKEDLTKRIKDWAAALKKEEVEVIVEPKVDGISTDLTYRNGTLTQALTRGNGRVGDDVTDNIRTIRTIPLNIPELVDVPVIQFRGETHMTFADFELANARQAELGLKLFANPRNATAGTVRSLDSTEVAQRRLSFVPYHCLSFDHTQLPVACQDRLHGWFRKLGFKPLPWYLVGNSLDEVIDLVLKFEAVRTRMPFPVDGAVIKLNNRLDWKQFPDATRAVRWGYAYKYAPTQVETKLLGITIQVGRTGELAPVAELEPVELDGSEISRATLCNERRIRVRDIRIGDTVVVQKDGMVIPGLVGTVPNLRPEGTEPFLLPDNCPGCGKPVAKNVTEDDGVDKGPLTHYVCMNPACPAIIKGTLLHWCAKENMDIHGVGEKAVDILVDHMGITSVAELYELLPPDLTDDGQFGPQEGQNIYEAIVKSKYDGGMESVLSGLGIDRIGTTIARKMARVYPDVLTFLTDGAGWNKYLGAADIRALSAANVKAVTLVAELEKLGVDIKSKTYKPDAADGTLAGKTICFTGTIGLDRTHATRLAEDKGAKVTSSVSKKTNYLVVGTDAGSKLTKAQELGTVTIIDEGQFLELVNQ